MKNLVLKYTRAHWLGVGDNSYIFKHFQPLSFDSDPSIILIKLKPTQNNLPGLDVVFGAVVLDVPGFENIPQFWMIAWTKLDEFSENFQTASDPPPSPPYFRKKMLRLFWEARKFATKFIRIGVTPPFFRKFIVFTAPKFPEKPQRNFSDRK